jgi:hypothetical protein
MAHWRTHTSTRAQIARALEPHVLNLLDDGKPATHAEVCDEIKRAARWLLDEHDAIERCGESPLRWRRRPATIVQPEPEPARPRSLKQQIAIATVERLDEIEARSAHDPTVSEIIAPLIEARRVQLGIGEK